MKRFFEFFASTIGGGFFVLLPVILVVLVLMETVAFIVESYENGSFTVMVPFAPTPTIGNIYHLAGDKVRVVDASMGYAVNTVMQWGIDSRKLFERK